MAAGLAPSVSGVFPSPRQGSEVSFASNLSSGRVDDEVVRYARWISSQANMAQNVEQKVIALSRRAAAELRKAEKERSILAARLGQLEAVCCRAGLITPEQLSDCMTQSAASHSLDLSKGAASGGSAGKGLAGDGTAANQHGPSLESVSNQIQDICLGRLEAAMLQERRAFGDQLARSYAELQSQMNLLHEEFRHQLRSQRSPQIEEASLQLNQPQHPTGSSTEQLRDEIRREVGKVHVAVRDEVRIVHKEVMSLDARVALLEEHAAGQLRLGSSHGTSPASFAQQAFPGSNASSLRATFAAAQGGSTRACTSPSWDSTAAAAAGSKPG
eukprot:TRINITY_DN30342_c0_g1_i1.p1 TRINITY_DN30342_c0_g1~~TRINITY_DN30342_c0_g1_i1.p1  ORF type:complete len:343 (+),score=75.38 TRINITY_DN30342_c0_g1_i1:45-1031(+)